MGVALPRRGDHSQMDAAAWVSVPRCAGLMVSLPDGVLGPGPNMLACHGGEAGPVSKLAATVTVTDFPLWLRSSSLPSLLLTCS